MWVCPKCSRTFGKENQHHFCGEPPESVEDYIASKPEEIQKYLYEILDTLRKTLPEAQERISWGMPTFWKEHNIIHFAGYKKHIGLYPGNRAVEVFQEQLKGYTVSKGTIQFPYDDSLPLELISRIAGWCYETGNRP